MSLLRHSTKPKVLSSTWRLALLHTARAKPETCTQASSRHGAQAFGIYSGFVEANYTSFPFC